MNKKYAFVASALLLSGCGGGGGGTPGLPSGPAPGPKPKSGNVAVTIKIPPHTGKSSIRKPQSSTRVPKYISASTQGIDFSVSQNGNSAGYTFAPLTPSSPGCTMSGGTLTCTVSFSVLPGIDTILVNTYDQPNPNSANVLSTVTVNQNFVAGKNTTLSFITNGVVQGYSIGFPQSFISGTPGSMNASINAFDADGNIITSPGNFDQPLSVVNEDATGSLTTDVQAVTSPGQQLKISYNGNPIGGSAVIYLCSPNFGPNCSYVGTPVFVEVPSQSLYAVDASSHFAAFAPGTTGNVAPIRNVTGVNTQLVVAYGLNLDPQKNLWIADIGADPTTAGIRAYYAGITGSAHFTTQPFINIAGNNTQLYAPDAVALDSAGNVYVTNAYYAGGSSANSITVYAQGATGNVAPIRVVAGASTGLNGPLGIALDGASNVYVANYLGNSITAYAAGANGNVLPIQTIFGELTGLNAPSGVALDASGNIYTANHGANSITVYPKGSNGDLQPIATISGSNTGLNSPLGIALDSSGNIYVANQGGNDIRVFAANSNGNVAPLHIISGAATTLTNPSAVAISP